MQLLPEIQTPEYFAYASAYNLSFVPYKISPNAQWHIVPTYLQCNASVYVVDLFPKFISAHSQTIYGAKQ